MRAALLALLIVPTAFAVPVSFDTPFQHDGHAELSNSTHLIVVWPPGTHMELAFHGLEITGANWTEAAKTHVSNPVAGVHAYDYRTVRDESQDLSGLQALTASGSGGWGSAILHADQIWVEATSHGSGRTIGPDERADADRRLHPYPQGTYWEQGVAVGDGQTAWVLENGKEAFPFSVKASGLRYTQLHNVSIDCTGRSCPDSPGYRDEGGDSVVAEAVARSYEYLQVWTSDGSSSGEGTAWTAMALGRSQALAVNGTLRLPLAACQQACAELGTFENKTLTVTGSTHLQRFQDVGGERLQAHISGDLNGAYLDEQAAARADSTEIVATGVGLALLVLLAKVMATLYSNVLRPEDDPEARVRVEQVVTEDPGARFREIMRASGLANGQVSHHLRRLQKQQRVKAYVRGRQKHFFPADPKWAHRWKPAVALRDVQALRVFRTLHAHPGLSQTELVDLYRQEGWSRAKVQRKLRLLSWADLVERGTYARRVCYSAAHPPETLGALGLTDILESQQPEHAPQPSAVA